MICFAKCLLTEEEFSICAIGTLDETPNIFIRDKHIFSSKRMLRKDYDRKGSVEKKVLVVDLRGLDAKAN
jgi:hypothetical protein